MGWRRGVSLVTAGLLFAACGGSGASLTDLAVGRWSCTVTDTSSHGLGAFDASVEITGGHKWDISVRVRGASTVELTGTWQLHGTSVAVEMTTTISGHADTRSMRFDGAKKETRAISVFADNVHESNFAVDWSSNEHIVFRQTESGGAPSAKGGAGDAWVADCRKPLSA
jgi:hypothetical protein